VVEVIGAVADITDQVNAEKSVKDSEVRYRALFENLHDPVLVADADTGILVDVNRAAESLQSHYST